MLRKRSRSITFVELCRRTSCRINLAIRDTQLAANRTLTLPMYDAPDQNAHVELRRQLTFRAAGGLVFLLALAQMGVVVAVALVTVLTPWTAGPAEAASILIGAAISAGLSLKALYWLWAPQPQPGGIAVPDELAPRFRRRIDRLSRRLRTPCIDQIVVTPDMNAALVCRPENGLFGRMRTFLLIGLPLIESLTPAQLAAVLVHELAHLHAQRRGLAAWAAHLRAWWLRVEDRIDGDPTPGGAVAQRLLARTMRRDIEDHLRLSRLDEFEADAWAAWHIGGRRLAGALVEVELKGRFVTENYWSKVMEQSRHRRRPSFRPYRDLQLGMQAGFVRDEALAEMNLQDDGDPDVYTHPTLHERLGSLRVGRALRDRPQSSAPTAAEHYFAPLLPTFAATFDRLWWHASKTEWRHRHRHARRRRERPGQAVAGSNTALRSPSVTPGANSRMNSVV